LPELSFSLAPRFFAAQSKRGQLFSYSNAQTIMPYRKRRTPKKAKRVSKRRVSKKQYRRSSKRRVKRRSSRRRR